MPTSGQLLDGHTKDVGGSADDGQANGGTQQRPDQVRILHIGVDGSDGNGIDPRAHIRSMGWALRNNPSPRCPVASAYP